MTGNPEDKAPVMSDTDLSKIIATFLENQEKRDIEFRKGISQASEKASKALVAIDSLIEDKKSLFDLHNESVSDRLKSGKAMWQTVLQGFGVASVIMAAILAPLTANIAANKAVSTMLVGLVSDMKVTDAVIQERQYFSDVINAIERDRQSQINGAWPDEGGRIAHPAPRFIYTPLEPK